MYSKYYSWLNAGIKSNKLEFFLENRSWLFHSIKFNEEKAKAFLLSDFYDGNVKKTNKDKYTLFRPVENSNAKNSILIFGGDYAYGRDLSANETFSL